MQHNVELITYKHESSMDALSIMEMQRLILSQEKKLQALESKLRQELDDKASLLADYEHVIEQLTGIKSVSY